MSLDEKMFQLHGEPAYDGYMSPRSLRINDAYIAFVNAMDPDGTYRFTGREWSALEAVVDALFPPDGTGK